MKKVSEKIVVLSPNKPFFGHILLLIPFFYYLKKKNPEAEIVVFSPVLNISLLCELGLCHRVVVYERHRKWRLYHSLRSEKPDQIYNLRPYSFGIQMIVSMFPFARKVGFKSGFGSAWCYQSWTQYDTTIYKSLLYVDLLKSEEASANPFEFFRSLPIQEHLGLSKRYICMLPGGGEGEHKKWGIENFIEMAHLLSQRVDVQFVFIMGPAERVEKEAIESSSVASLCQVLQNPSVAEISQITQGSLVTISNDCGPSHIAQMNGSRYVGIWGWEKQHPIKRMSEWSYPTDRAIHVVAEYNCSIKTVSPARIAEIVVGMC
jgi:ADP-heptose:LPS heptosyltransferase